MRTEIQVIESVPPSVRLDNEVREMPGPPPRQITDPWIRLSRMTFDDLGKIVKRELAVFKVVSNQIEVEWREYKLGQELTEVAPMSQYLAYETAQERA